MVSSLHIEHRDLNMHTDYIIVLHRASWDQLRLCNKLPSREGLKNDSLCNTMRTWSQSVPSLSLYGMFSSIPVLSLDSRNIDELYYFIYLFLTSWLDLRMVPRWCCVLFHSGTEMEFCPLITFCLIDIGDDVKMMMMHPQIARASTGERGKGSPYLLPLPLAIRGCDAYDDGRVMMMIWWR